MPCSLAFWIRLRTYHETKKAQDEQPSRAKNYYSTNVLSLQGAGGQVGAFGVTGRRPAPLNRGPMGGQKIGGVRRPAPNKNDLMPDRGEKFII